METVITATPAICTVTTTKQDVTTFACRTLDKQSLTVIGMAAPGKQSKPALSDIPPDTY